MEDEKKDEVANNLPSQLDVGKDVLTRYQKIHLRILSAALVISIITVLAIIYQVKNLAEQTRRNTAALDLQKRAVEAQTWQLIIQQMTDVDKIFVEHPDLYPYFFLNKQVDKDDPTYPKVKSMTIMLLDFMDGFEDDYVRQLSGMGDNGKNWVAWENYFIDQFRLSPALCESYKEYESWYAENGAISKFAKNGCVEQQKNLP